MYLYIINILLYINIVKPLVLIKNDFTSLTAGANITFHRPDSETECKSISMDAGPDLRYHTLISDAATLHTHEFAELFLIIIGKIKHLVNSEYLEWFEQLKVEMVKHDNLYGGLKGMKQLAPCTQEHLCKCFRNYMDKTPTEFINELRIKQAAKQIVETEEKILAVALELGFKSLSRFYSMFNKYYGISPAKYRSISRQNDIPI